METEQVVRTHTVICLTCAREAARLMAEAGRGYIVMIGLMRADVCEEDGSTQGRTKAAIQGSPESLRKTANEQVITM